MGTERLKPLHNFTMPCSLRWGNQRHVRCMKVNSNGQVSPVYRCSAADHHHNRRTARERDPSSEFLNGSDKLAEEGDDGIAAVREKVMFDLQTAADKMKESIFKDGLEEGEVRASVSPQRPPESAYGEPQRPWNLRTRRPACKTLVRNSGGGASATYGGGNGGDGKGLRLDMPKSLMRGTPAAAATVVEKSSMLKGGDGGGSGGATASGEKNERAKFSVALSKKEIEEDFSVVGLRLPRRPKKRPKMVQKQLDTLFPGLWLTEVTPDMYKVPDAAP